jgi:hypothetical protein
MFDWLKKEDEVEEPRGLPTFPDFPTHKGFGQAAIKDAVEDNKMPPIPKHHPSKKILEIPRPPIHPTVPQIHPEEFQEHAHQDVFVKIDKFHSAKKAMSSVKERLAEIENLLKKLRETTTKEEVQLISWEKELDIVKSKVREVSENIFEKVE